MQSTILAFVAFGMLLAFVQCTDKAPVAEYEIKEGLLSAGHIYHIKSKTNANQHFTIDSKHFKIGKEFSLLEGGKKLFTVKHDLTKVMSTWVIKTGDSEKEVGIIKNAVEFVGSEMNAKGTFGDYKIEGKFRNHEFTITKNGEKIAMVDKKSFHLHDTYGLTVYGNADQQPLMVLFAVIIDEIREH